MPGLEYLDFDLQIGRAKRRCCAKVIHSPAGESSEHFFRWPFDPRDLEVIRITIENIILRSRFAALRHCPPLRTTMIQEVGVRLFDAVFDGSIKSCYDRSRALADSERKGLRLRFHLDPALSGWPWEFLYNSESRDFLAMSAKTPIVRYLEIPERPRPLVVSEALRVLVVIASPQDEPYIPLDTEREKEEILEALREPRLKGILEVEFLEGEDTFRRLMRRQRGREEYHILHFIGHGAFDPAREEGYLVGENERGLGASMTSQQLARLPKDTFDTRLVILNACEGAVAASWDPFTSVAAALVRAGIPAVIAMQFEISDRAAQIFAKELYTAVADGYPVDAALADTRKVMDQAIPDNIEWATPVLFMRSPDGVLFDLVRLQPRVVEEQELAPEEYRRAGDYFYQQAEEALAAGETSEVEKASRQAREFYESAIRLGVEEAECYYRLGKLCQRLGRLEEARAAYLRAIAINPVYVGLRSIADFFAPAASIPKL